jgi:hypothetical protein
MRSLVWTGVFVFLMLEICLTLVLAIPLRRRWRNWLCMEVSKLELKKHLKLPLAFVGFSLFFALLDSVNYLVMIMGREWEDEKDRRYVSPEDRLIVRQLDKEKEYKTERNLYMAGFALTLIFVIGRMTDLMQEHAELEADLEKLRLSSSPVDSATGSQESTATEVEMKPLTLKKKE